MLLAIRRLSFMANAVLLSALMSVGLYGQGTPDFNQLFRNIYLMPFRQLALKTDLERHGMVFYNRGNPDKRNDQISRYVYKHINSSTNYVSYGELDEDNYEICCNVLGLTFRPSQDMLDLYYDGNAVQFPFDETKTDLLQEFRKLGWSPPEERLRDYLVNNPNDQEALGLYFELITGKIQTLVTDSQRAADPAASRIQILSSGDGDEPDPSALPKFIDAMKMLNEAKALDWLSVMKIPLMFQLRFFAGAPILSENREFQQEINAFVELLGNTIKSHPSAIWRYNYWAGFAALTKKPDPAKLLSELSIPPGGQRMQDIVSQLANIYFDTPLRGEDAKSIIDEGFKFLDAGAEWMEATDPHLNGTFAYAYVRLAIGKTEKLIRYKRFSEIEKYLEDLRTKAGLNWSDITEGLKNPQFAFSGKAIDEIPDPYKKKVDEILERPVMESGRQYFIRPG